PCWRSGNRGSASSPPPPPPPRRPRPRRSLRCKRAAQPPRGCSLALRLEGGECCQVFPREILFFSSGASYCRFIDWPTRLWQRRDPRWYKLSLRYPTVHRPRRPHDECARARMRSSLELVDDIGDGSDELLLALAIAKGDGRDLDLDDRQGS